MATGPWLQPDASHAPITTSYGRVGQVNRPDEPWFRLEANDGHVAVVGALGARLIELWAPDRHGTLGDVTLGFDRDDEYRQHQDMYVGVTIGRVAGRIRRARFELDGTVYELAANEPPNHLHGGATRSFDRVRWTARPQETAGHPSVRFDYRSPHLEEGYPGALDVSVTYTLAGPELLMNYEAHTDRATPVSLTSHAYWNLAGSGADTVLDHDLRIAAHAFTPADSGLVPGARSAPVSGTPLDFMVARTIGDRIGRLDDDPAAGYDHNYLIDGADGSLRPAAWLHHPGSGRTMQLSTTQPALQVYTGNRMRPVTGKVGQRYGHRSAICLEPQATPDAVNGPEARAVVLEPGATYRQSSVYLFGLEHQPARDASSFPEVTRGARHHGPGPDPTPGSSPAR